MDKTLIIKTGATGDVLRTTPLLHIIEGEIHWLTFKYNIAILPNDCSKLKQIYSLEEDIDQLQQQEYNRIISLEEDKSVCSVINQLKFNFLTGVYMNGDIVQYTSDSALLYDMSLISVLGKEKADEIKFANKFSYQELIFKMVGKDFSGEKYWMKKSNVLSLTPGNKIGIEARAGERWQGKIWNGYDQLSKLLISNGYEVMFFSAKNTLEEYINDICSCKLVIAGDTLAMHISLAASIPTLAIFTCTSPNEIYDYNLLEKIITPKLSTSFYKTSPVNESIEAIKVEDVYLKCQQMLSSPLKKSI